MATKDVALATIQSLVLQFDDQKDYYRSRQYNETETRNQFINPFWMALGWDVNNSNGCLESYREVIQEARILIDDRIKRPDYLFRYSDGTKLFYLEAKQPSIVIKSDKPSAYQIRRYGWNAKLPINIVSDFEEFAVYDCTFRPNPADETKIGRRKYITYLDYINEFDYLWDNFSRAHVEESIDRYVQNDKKGATTVDHDFLISLGKWREKLARNIALRNNGISEDELNFVVQSTLDRIIFLRFAEDRNIEQNRDLRTAIETGHYYQNLLQRFHIADQKYNSGLFDFDKDIISTRISIDNNVIKNIVSELYHPKSPYEFSALSVEILGSAYEQFLGKRITIVRGSARIEEKPEVRKANGVYYTPQYIVDYIVKNTVGKLTENKTPEEVSKLKIVDPACGSGSFLIGAYHHLLNWHRDYYTQCGKQNITGKNSPLTPSGELTTAEKKRILINNIYGVDLDGNAVEVTKLSLLLKCMEGETNESIEVQQQLFHDRVLPSLDNNIKNGNSLIDLDYYGLNFGEERIVKPFSWQRNFPVVFAQGGFDCVIGNPPYVEFKQLDKIFKSYLERIYNSANGKYDLYVPFIEKSIQLLNKNGVSSFILPSMFTKRDYGKSIRKYVTQTVSIQALTYFGDFQVFKGVTVFPFIFFFKNGKVEKTKITLFPTQKGLTHEMVSRSLNNDLSDPVSSKYYLSASSFDENNWTITDNSISEIKTKIENTANSIRLKDISKYIFVGIQSGKDEVFYIDEKTRKEYGIEKGILFPIFRGRDINKYRAKWGGTYCIYPYNLKTNEVIGEKELKSKFPNTYKYLIEKRHLLKGRSYFDNSTKKWYELWCERVYSKFNQIKIVNAEISDNNRFFLDDKCYLGNTKVFSTVLKDDWSNHYLYVLGILNSKVLEFYHRQISVPKAGGFFEYKTQFLNLYPIRVIDFSNSKEKGIYETISNLSDQLLRLNKDIQAATVPNHREQLQSKIGYCEDRINTLVYELYGLTEEEVKIIEAG